MEINQLTVYCYECDEFVVNDTQDRSGFVENLLYTYSLYNLNLEGFWRT